MNPVAEAEIQRLLQVSRAILIRDAKHQVWQLPNGAKYVVSKTPSDHRTNMNQLSDLRKIVKAMDPGLLPAKREHAVAEPPPRRPEPIDPPLPVEPPPQISLRGRISDLIGEQEALREAALEESTRHDHNVKVLMSLAEHAEVPGVEEILLRLFPNRPEPGAVKLPEPLPPSAIVDRVQVTKHLVRAAIETIKGEFTINDVKQIMTQGRRLDPKESVRIRQSIYSSLATLEGEGHVSKTTVGKGKGVESRYSRHSQPGRG